MAKKENETELEKLQREQAEAAQGVKDASANYKAYVDEGYKASEDVTKAKAAYETANANLAGYAPYTNPNAAAMQQALSAIVNRPAFKFSTDGDALYERYKNDYQAAGKKAMEDTMGQAAMLTGGYGNSYAATAGAQAYNDYLGKMDEIVPQLYQMALDKYNMEGDQLAQKYGVLASDDERGYSRWAAERGYLADLADRAQNAYYNERAYDYGQWGDRGNALSTLWNMANGAYDVAANAENTAYQRQWNEDERAYQREQDAIANQLAYVKAHSGGSSGSGSRSSGSSAASGKDIDYNGMSKDERAIIDKLVEDGDVDGIIRYVKRREAETGNNYDGVFDYLEIMGLADFSNLDGGAGARLDVSDMLVNKDGKISINIDDVRKPVDAVANIEGVNYPFSEGERRKINDTTYLYENGKLYIVDVDDSMYKGRGGGGGGGRLVQMPK